MPKYHFMTLVTILCLFFASGCAQTDIGAPEPQSTPSSAEQPAGELSATGVYTGQIDGNSIEIKIDGQPEDRAYRAFAFSKKSRLQFAELSLSENTPVKITYIDREGQQALLTTIGRR